MATSEDSKPNIIFDVGDMNTNQHSECIFFYVLYSFRLWVHLEAKTWKEGGAVNAVGHNKHA